MASDPHRAYLSLGSNIEPEINLRQAVHLLGESGSLAAVSNAWESHAVGTSAPNFLNACVLYLTPLPLTTLVEQVIRPIEASLGRIRSPDKNAARQIDVDVVLYDDQPLRLEYWDQAFMIVPLAELLPEFEHPITHERLLHAATRLRVQAWIMPRSGILKGFSARVARRLDT